MSQVRRSLRGDIERPLVGDDDFVPPSPSSLGDGRGQGERPHAPTDRAWAVAFKLNVVITVIAAVYQFVMVRSTLPNVLGLQKLLSSERGTEIVVAGANTMGLDESLSSESGAEQGAGAVLLMSMIAVPMAYCMSSVMLRMMSSRPALFLKVAGVTFLLLCAAAVVALAMAGAEEGAGALAIVFVGLAVIFFLRPGRIAFAAANLKVAAVAVKATPNLTFSVLCQMAVRVLWFAVASMAYGGLRKAFGTVLGPDGETYRAVNCYDGDTSDMLSPSCECSGTIVSDGGCEVISPNHFLLCFWAVGAAWVPAMIANVIAATVSNSVAAWWTSADSVESVWVSFRRVMRSSLGSMCKVAWIAGAVLSPALGSVLSVRAARTLWLPLLLVRFVVIYLLYGTVVVFIGMYRLSFSEEPTPLMSFCKAAADRAWALLHKHGLTLFINDVDLAMGLAFVCLAVWPMVLAAIMVWVSMPPLPNCSSCITSKVIFQSLVIATLAIFSTLEVVVYACKATCMCFLQDSESFSASHDRRLYDSMYRPWKQMKLSHPKTAEE